MWFSLLESVVLISTTYLYRTVQRCRGAHFTAREAQDVGGLWKTGRRRRTAAGAAGRPGMERL